MGKHDKDRHQKELAIQYCIARGFVPFLEVLVSSSTDLTDAVENVTDLDVLGLSTRGDGGLFRVLFDCKSGQRMSAINRAFWAAGVAEYVGVDEAIVLLKTPPSRSHRLSALKIRVDLHDESSFVDLANTFEVGFPVERFYQSRISRWETLTDEYAKWGWAKQLEEILHSTVPLSHEPWSAFRKLLAELRAVKGNFDPEKAGHVAIVLDTVSACFVLWSNMARDMRRFYDPQMKRDEFESTLRYYLWGGKESYLLRKQMSERNAQNGQAKTIELPEWKSLLTMSGLFVQSPQSVLRCSFAAKDLAIRQLNAKDHALDANIASFLSDDRQVRPFVKQLTAYLVKACSIPSEFIGKIDTELDSFTI